MESTPIRKTDETRVRLHTVDLKPRMREASKPSELIQIHGHAELTLNARRAITILWHHAHLQGIRDNRDYTIEIDELKTDGHKGYEMVVEAVEALMRTLIVVKLPDGMDRRVQFLGGNDMTDSDRPGGILTYSFDTRLMNIIKESTIWGKISLPVLMAFTSKYAISLYENVAQLVNLTLLTAHEYTLDAFREMLGVQPGRYATFGELNRHVIKMAVDEINGLAHFNMTVLPIKTGKKVTHIRIGWHLKGESALKSAWQETHRHRIGRRARISNQVENVIAVQPSIGRILRLDRKRLSSPKTS